MMKEYDYLIVGAGLFGACFAYRACALGKRCLVIEQRPQVGGNLFCSRCEGIDVHCFGPHIFHTSNRVVWDFVNSFVPFVPFIYSPLAHFRGRYFNLPFNMNTFYALWGLCSPDAVRARLLEQGAVLGGGFSAEHLEEQAIAMVGRDVFELLVKGYTQKQWGRPCSELPPFIIKRLPLRFTFDNRYFDDVFQGVPRGGYNALIEGLLVGVECRCGVDYLLARSYWDSLADRVVFTGSIDAFYDYCFGELEYRSLRFEHVLHDCANVQGCAVVNETDVGVPFTRSIEHKHFSMFGDALDVCPLSVVSREFPLAWRRGLGRFYPVNDAQNNARYGRYRALGDAEDSVIFGGRLGAFRYDDMAPIIERVLQLEIV